MTTSPRQSIDDGFVALAARLEPIIAERLAPHLSGLPWETLLRELDRMKGRNPGEHSPHDPAAQLRVITERLGSIGYPFDDHRRFVSTHGNVLRYFRNQAAHHAELSWHDAYRVHQCASELLAHLGDEAGAQEASARRDEVIAMLAREHGRSDAAEAEEITRTIENVVLVLDEAIEAFDSNVADDENKVGHCVGSGAELSGTVIEPAGDAENIEMAGIYEPWIPVVVGTIADLDDLPKKAAKEKVRSLAGEIVALEGPVHVDRVATLIGRSFAVGRLAPKRRAQIIRHIGAADGVEVVGKHAWPADIDRATWGSFRRNGPNSSRKFAEIAVEEVANAMAACMARNPSQSDEEVDRVTLACFGRERRSAAYKGHLDKARALIGRSGP